jgi:hypothetical protein
MATPVTVNEVLDGQAALDVECLDRIYLIGYVPICTSAVRSCRF